MANGDDVDSLQVEKSKDFYEVTADMVLFSHIRVSCLRTDQDGNNFSADRSLPCILLLQINALGPREFYEVLKMHKDRLSFKRSAQDMVRPEAEFRVFKKHIACPQSAELDAIMFEKYTVKGGDLFEKVWAPFA